VLSADSANISLSTLPVAWHADACMRRHYNGPCVLLGWLAGHGWVKLVRDEVNVHGNVHANSIQCSSAGHFEFRLPSFK
jgi:hypothetical protein